jgi:hypothetical protein
MAWCSVEVRGYFTFTFYLYTAQIDSQSAKKSSPIQNGSFVINVTAMAGFPAGMTAEYRTLQQKRLDVT